MSKRTYNIFFHLHTVSGIIITVGLFVIFFAGAFTLFLKEIESWENTTKPIAYSTNAVTTKQLDLDRLVLELETKGYDLYGRGIYIDLQEAGSDQSFFLSESEDTLAVGEARESKNLQVNRETYNITEKSKNSSKTLGGLLYELHFFYQLGDPGYYLAGFVSLFFLFAMLSGLIIHWKKIISNFYLFRPYEKLKTVWTDAHTALGIIGIPFQFMYALTGAWFGLGILVATSSALLYGGDQSKYYEEVEGHYHETLGTRIKMSDHKLNVLLDSAANEWEGYKLTYIALHMTASNTMKMNIYGEVNSKSSFFNFGEHEFDVVSKKITHMHDPFHKSYDEIVSALIHRLHFGYFGLEGWKHITVKVLYFLLSIATCFVIITGVLIWLEARNKKNIPEKKRKFNQQVGHIYLSVCLSMLPVTALSFLITKLLPHSLAGHKSMVINLVFFGGWLVMSIFFWLRKDNHFTNKYSLLISSVLGLCIPFTNGLVSGNWIWLSYTYHHHQIFLIDALWICLSVICLTIVYKVTKHDKYA